MVDRRVVPPPALLVGRERPRRDRALLVVEGVEQIGRRAGHPVGDSAARHGYSRGDELVAGADRARHHHLGVDPTEVEPPALGRVDEAHRLDAEAGDELGAPGVRDLGDLDDGVADLQPRARRQLLRAEVEVDVELVAGERPAVTGAGDEGDRPGVHHVQLHLRVRRAVVQPPARTVLPRVADESDGHVELAAVEHLALADPRASDDHLQRAGADRGRPYLVEPGLQLLRGEVRHRRHLLAPAAASRNRFTPGAPRRGGA